MDPVVVNERIQSLNGREYQKKKSNGYYQSNDTLLHREVWRINTGAPPPPGRKFNVHHIDGNKDNNAFSNLSLISSKDHAREHMTPERSQAFRENMLKNAIPAAKAWHASPEGRKWHVEHALDVAAAMKRRPLEIRKCAHCENEFATRDPRARFCGLNCRAAATRARRAAGIPVNQIRNTIGKQEPKPRICIDCRVEYLTKSGRATRCEDCRIDATNARAREAWAAKKETP